ncbi:polysaccharide deacetylase family protein [Desulfosporosinus sp. SB140]|uniref:polysaccharide deacetylase family protein n=1 Tax=Desulfosporosinus paludis TaxID=3115649 RepID=UPI003890AD42
MIGKQSSSKSSTSHLKYLRLGGFLLVMVLISSLAFSIKTSNFTGQKPAESGSPINKSMNDQRSESLRQLSPSSGSAGPIKVVYELPEKEPVVFITIDDGWYPNEQVITLMQQYHLPITTFLVEQAAQEHVNFWDEFIKAGGHIQDHTINHPYLTHLSLADKKAQISQPIDYFQRYNPTVDELRPPYGDFNEEVGQAAWASGIKYIVMWNAEMKNSVLSTRSSQGLKSGDIILLHWVPGLDRELLTLLNIIQKQNLGIADLTQALKGEALTISWLKDPIPLPKPAPACTIGATATSGTSNTPGTTGNPGTTTIPETTTSPLNTVSPANTASPGHNGTSGNAGTPGTTNTPDPSTGDTNVSGA